MADRMGLFDQQPSTTLVFNAFLNRWIAASTNAFAGKEIVLYLVGRRFCCFESSRSRFAKTGSAPRLHTHVELSGWQLEQRGG